MATKMSSVSKDSAKKRPTPHDDHPLMQTPTVEDRQLYRRYLLQYFLTREPDFKGGLTNMDHAKEVVSLLCKADE